MFTAQNLWWFKKQCLVVCPVTKWWCVQGVPLYLHIVSCDRLPPIHSPAKGKQLQIIFEKSSSWSMHCFIHFFKQKFSGASIKCKYLPLSLVISESKWIVFGFWERFFFFFLQIFLDFCHFLLLASDFRLCLSHNRGLQTLSAVSCSLQTNASYKAFSVLGKVIFEQWLSEGKGLMNG